MSANILYYSGYHIKSKTFISWCINRTDKAVAVKMALILIENKEWGLPEQRTDFMSENTWCEQKAEINKWGYDILVHKMKLNYELLKHSNNYME